MAGLKVPPPLMMKSPAPRRPKAKEPLLATLIALLLLSTWTRLLSFLARIPYLVAPSWVSPKDRTFTIHFSL
ncbi:hypothetical protein D3C73_1554140 [compost metagenome]